jgi:hypothetical protein
MHAVRLGFVNWGVRKVSGMSGNEAIHRERTPGSGEKRSPRRCLTASRTTVMDPHAGLLPGTGEQAGFENRLKVRGGNPRRRAPPGRRLGP